MSRKKEKTLKGMIAILTILVIILSGYIICNQWTSRNNPKEDKKTSVIDDKTPSNSQTPTPTDAIKEPEERELSKDTIETLENMVYDTLTCGAELFDYYQCDKITADTFSNQFKNTIVARKMYERDANIINSNQKEPIYTEKEILELKNTIFGTKDNFKIVTSDDCGEFKKLEDGTYKINIGCGNMCTQPTITKIEKAIQKGDRIYLDQKVIFEFSWNHDEDDGMTAYYYSDYRQRNLIDEKEFVDSTDYFENYKNIDWEKHGKQASIYRHTYQVNGDGTYTFLQIERIK